MSHCLTMLAAYCREPLNLRLNSFWRATLAVIALFFAPLGSEEAQSAMPGKVADMDGILPRTHITDQQLPITNIITKNKNHKNKESASAAISGSPFPGVIDHLLQRPLINNSETGQMGIHINYPSFGNKLVDSDIRDWVGGIADAFASYLDLQKTTSYNLDNTNIPVDELLQKDQYDPTIDIDSEPQNNNFELWGEYNVSRPSDAAVSISFELWNYTGSEQGNLDIITLNYSLLTGQRLTFVDIFEKPDVALELMSSWSRKILEPRLGATRRTQMLNEGTAPLVENFSSITLTPEGVCINFQPWQVAPWDAGIQKVTMPLEELLPSSPLLALWGK